MNPDCQLIALLVTRSVDEELDTAERQQLEQHLAACPDCRAEAGHEHAVHDLLRTRQHGLRETAPVALRARVAAAAVRPSPARGARWLVPLAAGLVILLVGAGALALFAPPGSILAAELTLDHLKCKYIAKDEPDLSAAQFQERWKADHGWPVTVPAGSDRDGLELSTVRLCLFHGGQLAHVIYHYRGQTVSLFELPRERPAAPPLEIMGTRSAQWSSGGRTFGLVGAVSDSEFAELAEYFQRAVP